MGYTHYFGFKKNPADIENGELKFMNAVAMFREGLKKLPNLKLCGGLGKGEPIINDKEVCFNGDASTGDDYETFRISFANDGDGFDDFCKTARQPYDVAVCLAILCFGEAFGDDFQYSSDGYCPRDRQVIDGEVKLEEGWAKANEIMTAIYENTPQTDVVEYARKYGYDALGYAIVRMIDEGDFNPDWEFARKLWEYDGVACKPNN